MMVHALSSMSGDHFFRDYGRAALLPAILCIVLERSVWGGQNAAQYPDLDQAGFVRSGEARFSMLMPSGPSDVDFCCYPVHRLTGARQRSLVFVCGSVGLQTRHGGRSRQGSCLAVGGIER